MKSTGLFTLFILIVTPVLIIPVSIASELKLVADEWPPFTSDKPGQKIAVDLVEQALNRSGIKAKANIIQWNDVLDGVKTDKYDAIVGAWKNFEREKFLLFSRPYLENRIMLVGRTDNKIKFNALAQLENKKVGIVEGYAYGEAIANNQKIATIKSLTVTDNLRKLLDNAVDYILTDSIVAQGMMQHLPRDIKSQLVVYKKAVVTKKLYFAVRKDYPEANVLMKKFNQSIRNMIADGSYNRILGFEWLIADTDGDGVGEYIVGDHVQSKTTDPASSDNSYHVFSDEENSTKRPAKKYRVLNLEYNSWGEAEEAIRKAQATGSLQYENKEASTVNIFSGKF